MFATTEPEKAIATIRSRTHHYPFRLVPPAILRELLEEILAAEQIGYEPAVLPLVVRAGAGSALAPFSVRDELLAGAGEEGSALRPDGRPAGIHRREPASLFECRVDIFF